jgi:hypothetical protein
MRAIHHARVEPTLTHEIGSRQVFAGFAYRLIGLTAFATGIS